MADNKVDMFDLAAGVPVVDAVVEGALVPKPKASIGMSKKIIFILGAAIGLFMIVFMIALDKVDEKKSAPKEAVEDKPKDIQPGTVPADMDSSQRGSIVTPAADMPAEAMSGGVKSGPQSANPNSVLGTKPVVPALGAPGVAGANAANNPEAQRAMQAKHAREDRLMQARVGGLDAKGYQDGTVGGGGAAGAAATGVQGAVARIEAMKAAAQTPAAGGSMFGSSAGAGGGSGDQDQKLKFVSEGGSVTGGYHTQTVVPPLSPYQLNAGAYIPAVLEMAVNSDLPGQVTARVRENVYASINENCLLIPSASRLVGSYDSRVSVGQARQLVVWSRVMFPNGSELNLGGMASADVSGQSGLSADVDNHWMRLFGAALGMTAVTAGVQIAVGVPATVANGVPAQPSAAQAVSTALTQQFGQLGGQVMGRYLNIQPTLRNFPGERFNVVVPKNVVFPKCYR